MILTSNLLCLSLSFIEYSSDSNYEGDEEEGVDEEEEKIVCGDNVEEDDNTYNKADQEAMENALKEENTGKY